ncbi:MAG TPA: glycosyltransferase [Terracidiphilus sp.]|nr:glycosyltransferase [Terracidiphilus sp.]
MRILHFIASIDSATGGPVEGLRHRCAIYRAGGHEVEIATLDSPEFVRSCQFPARLIGLGPGRGTYRYSPHAVPWLKANLERFDVVFVNGVWNYNTLAAHRALKGTDIPWAIFTHGMLDPYFKERFPLKHLKKSIYWHGMLRQAFRDAHAVLFTTEEERILARQSFSRYDVREIVVPYGTFGPDCDTGEAVEEFLARWPDLRGKRIAISLGRIHPKKGTDVLIAAFAQTLAKDAEWRLVIAGPDQVGWKKELEARARKLGAAERITWTGTLKGKLKWGAFAASEVFVLPSHQENFGIVVAEAMACGLPVIVSNKVNLWREVVKGGAGFVDKDTLEGTTASLARWSALSAGEIAALRVRSRRTFEEEFDFNSTAKRVLENVEELARATPRYKPVAATQAGR